MKIKFGTPTIEKITCVPVTVNYSTIKPTLTIDVLITECKNETPHFKLDWASCNDAWGKLQGFTAQDLIANFVLSETKINFNTGIFS